MFGYVPDSQGKANKNSVVRKYHYRVCFCCDGSYVYSIEPENMPCVLIPRDGNTIKQKQSKIRIAS